MTQKRKIVKLTANENFYGCSPKVLQAIKPKLNEVSLYPNSPENLKSKIAEKYNVKNENIILGAGSVRIIESLILNFVNGDEEVLIFDNSFIAYSQLCSFHGRKCVMAPLDNGRCNPQNLLPKVNAKTKLVFISNPNNPTGTIISHKEFEDFLSKISPETVVAIDEAYSEYVFDKSFPDSLKLQKKFKNVVILHSFSKIYGLAGLRIGYGIADQKLITKMMSTQLPFTLNTVAADAAIAALGDDNFIANSKEKNRKSLDFLYKNLTKSGFKIFPSQSNFIYVIFENDEQKEKFYNILMQNQIAVCDMKVFGQQKSIRITIGDMKTSKEIVKLINEKCN